MAVLIDASVLIAVERRGVPPEHAIALVRTEDGALACITASELLKVKPNRGDGFPAW